MKWTSLISWLDLQAIHWYLENHTELFHEPEAIGQRPEFGNSSVVDPAEPRAGDFERFPGRDHLRNRLMGAADRRTHRHSVLGRYHVRNIDSNISTGEDPFAERSHCLLTLSSSENEVPAAHIFGEEDRGGVSILAGDDRRQELSDQATFSPGVDAMVVSCFPHSRIDP